jgi:DNA replicative helicase MCM subunit Mcm2 (Cdc46/Mcm family)
MNDDSISDNENDLEKMIQDLSNQTYGSIVEDHADDNQDTSNDDSSGQDPDQDLAEEISVSEALRRKNGYVKVRGQVIGYSEIYNMISEVTIACTNCGFSDTLDYSKKPVFRSPVKELAKCPRKECSVMGQTQMATMRYSTAMHIDLQDPDKFSEIERIKVRLFEDNTRDVFAGKLVTITGHLHVVRENDNPNNKLVTVLYAESIDDIRKQQQELTQKDIDDILAWKRSIEDKKGCLVDELASYFAPQIIGYEHVKKGLLMVAANAGIPNCEKRNPKRLRLNALLIGDPSLAKSTFLNKIVEVVPNARYESCQSSTGLSLTAQVSKEEGGIYTLRHGPIPLANGSICALNEIGQMHISEHKHFLDCMQEGRFTLNKYGFNAPIISNTSIVASANPINNTWKDPEEIQQSEFPTLTQIVHRFDFIFIFIENTEPGYLSDYTRRREEIAKKSAHGVFDDYDNFLRKYLMYARTFDPTISEEAREMLNEYWINMGSVGIRGLPRKLESLESAAIALTKLKLKNVVDAEDVTEIMEFYNLILLHFRQSAAVSRNPRDIAYEECVDVLKSSKFAISYEEIIRSACSRNEKVSRYIGDKYKLEHNIRLRPIVDLLQNHNHIVQTSQKPIVFQWIDTARDTDNNNLPSDLSDASDVSDTGLQGPDKNNSKEKDQENKNGSVESISDVSDTSDRKQKYWQSETAISYSDVEEFFKTDDRQILSLPDHSLEQSPCYPIIDSKSKGSHIWYHCKLHPKVKNVNLSSIEHHCKYSDHNQHKAAILRLLKSQNSINYGLGSILTTDRSPQNSAGLDRGNN